MNLLLLTSQLTCLLFSAFCSTHGSEQRDEREAQLYDVLILGAGMAGVTAAHTLTQKGIDNFLIIEGTGRIGGRMKDVEFGGVTVELGASWITGAQGNHPRAPANPMYDLGNRHGIQYYVNDYDDWRVIDDMGKDISEAADKSYEKMMQTYEFALEYRKTLLKNLNDSDVSILSGMKYGGWDIASKTPVDQANEVFEIDFYTTYPPEVSSLRYYYGNNEESPYDDDEMMVYGKAGGFAGILDGMLEEGVPDWRNKIRFNTTVEKITYDDHGVTIETCNGVFKGKFAVVTFS